MHIYIYVHAVPTRRTTSTASVISLHSTMQPYGRHFISFTRIQTRMQTKNCIYTILYLCISYCINVYQINAMHEIKIVVYIGNIRGRRTYAICQCVCVCLCKGQQQRHQESN